MNNCRLKESKKTVAAHLNITTKTSSPDLFATAVKICVLMFVSLFCPLVFCWFDCIVPKLTIDDPFTHNLTWTIAKKKHFGIITADLSQPSQMAI